MQANIHPEFFVSTVTDISTGKKFKIGTTKADFSVEISSASHPFYTGEEKIIDTENMVDKFIKKQKAAAPSGNEGEKSSSKRMKRAQLRKTRSTKVESQQPLTLKDMLKNVS